MSEADDKEDQKTTLAKEIMDENELTGKPTLNKLLEIIDQVGYSKELVLHNYHQYKQKENYANEVMNELELKGKATRIKIMRIIDLVGRDKKKIRTSFLRSTITSRIEHE
jgi:hypothetical protein